MRIMSCIRNKCQAIVQSPNGLPGTTNGSCGAQSANDETAHVVTPACSVSSLATPHGELPCVQRTPPRGQHPAEKAHGQR